MKMKSFPIQVKCISNTCLSLQIYDFSRGFNKSLAAWTALLGGKKTNEHIFLKSWLMTIINHFHKAPYLYTMYRKTWFLE